MTQTTGCVIFTVTDDGHVSWRQRGVSLWAGGVNIGYIHSNTGTYTFEFLIADTDVSVEAWTSSQRICLWESTQTVPVLTPGDIHLWWVSLRGTDNELKEFWKVLSNDEQRRAERYRFAQHRDAYIFGRGVLRFILGAYTREAAHQIEFRFGQFGKPNLVNRVGNKRLCFNYTDANRHALYGFTWNQEIGVDLEDLNRKVDFERIVERKFTKTEADTILGLPPSRQKSAFLTCWTRKEGYGKAEGWGIHYPLDSIEVCVDCESDRVELAAGDAQARNWIIQQIYPTNRFVGTVVYPAIMDTSETFTIRYMQVNPGELLGS